MVGMEPSDVVRSNVNYERRHSRLTAKRLAEITTDLGTPMNRGSIASFETGRQQSITINQLMVLAQALGVAPATLLTPHRGEQLHVGPTLTLDAEDAAKWVTGYPGAWARR